MNLWQFLTKQRDKDKPIPKQRRFIHSSDLYKTAEYKRLEFTSSSQPYVRFIEEISGISDLETGKRG